MPVVIIVIWKMLTVFVDAEAYNNQFTIIVQNSFQELGTEKLSKGEKKIFNSLDHITFYDLHI